MAAKTISYCLYQCIYTTIIRVSYTYIHMCLLLTRGISSLELHNRREQQVGVCRRGVYLGCCLSDGTPEANILNFHYCGASSQQTLSWRDTLSFLKLYLTSSFHDKNHYSARNRRNGSSLSQSQQVYVCVCACAPDWSYCQYPSFECLYQQSQTDWKSLPATTHSLIVTRVENYQQHTSSPISSMEPRLMGISISSICYQNK